MKNKISSAIIVILLAILPVTAWGDLRTTFAIPRDSVRTSCYWYWLSGHISEQGVVNDLKAMKQAGINTAFIGNMGLGAGDGIATPGKVKILSDEWFRIVRKALATATELGIDIGIFNAPGWSQAGGPWNKPEGSMRYLANQTVEVDGGAVNVSFDTPGNGGYYSDVKVLAYRLPDSYVALGNANTDIAPSQKSLFDGDLTTEFALEDSCVVDLRPRGGSFTARSIAIYPAERRIYCTAEVWAKNGSSRTKVAEFKVDRTLDWFFVGYDAYAPIVHALADTEAEELSIVFRGVNKGAGLKEIRISSEPVVDQYPEKILAKMLQIPTPTWSDYKWEQIVARNAVPAVAAADVVDLSASLKGNSLTCTLPEGRWRIVRTFMLPTNIENAPTLDDGRGLEVDRWDLPSLRHHYDSFMGRIIDYVPAEERKCLKYMVCDSYERAAQNFGNDFIEQFKSRFGYDPTPFLLTYGGIIVADEEQSNRFLWDVRRMIADRLAYDHIGELRKMANADGMRLWLENYGHWGFCGEFLQYGGQADDVAGEFWSEGELGNIENRAATSCGHIYGKPTIFSESFTCGGAPFSRYPATMKQRGDRFFSEGINSTLLHLVVSQPDETTLPGVNAAFSNEFNRKNTWYSHMDLFTDYLKRCNLLQQQGSYVADVAYFIGEDAPVMTGATNPALPAGYQFDYINAEVIMNRLSATADHRLCLPGTLNAYRLLVLPPLQTITPELLARIRTLVDDGAIILGPKPQKSPSLKGYPDCDARVRSLADELWGASADERVMRQVGKGFVLSGYDVKEVLDMFGISPDATFRAYSGKCDVAYAHNTTADGREIYFVANQSPTDTIAIDASLRTTGLNVELWNPVTGKIASAAFADTGERTVVPLRLHPLESTFVVMSKEQAAPVESASASICRATLNDGWRVTFTDKFGKTLRRNNFAICDLKDSADDELRHFSGEAVYSRKFDCEAPAGARVVLDLGKVGVMAKVTVNGRYVGGVWTAPYSLDITEALRRGENTVEISVVNTWVNRLIGDAAKPADKRKTNCNFNDWRSDSPLQSSGLIGPVRILFEQTK